MRTATKLTAPTRTTTYKDYTVMTGTFYGINRGLTVTDGQTNEQENLTSDYYPQLATCHPRVSLDYASLKDETYHGSIAKGTDLYTCAGEHLYQNGVLVKDTDGENLKLQDAGNGSSSRKLLVNMGANIVIWPDKVYYNTITAEFGSMEASASGRMTFAPCTLNGTVKTYTASATAPSSPSNGQQWYDTTNDKLQIYSEASKSWKEVTSTYIRIHFAGIGDKFSLNDSVYLTYSSGSALSPDKSTNYNATADTKIKAMCGQSYVVYNVDSDNIVITGLIPGIVVYTNVSLKRRVPDFDFVCQANNRLWGCQYGKYKDQLRDDSGEFINQLMACAQGDFKNWETYDQVSTDSYAVSLGSDGAFTGCIGLNGVPCFLKEGVITRISGSIPSSFSTTTTACRGVDAGDSLSLQRIEQSLLWKTVDDIVLYNSGEFSSIGKKLGQTTLAGDTIAAAVYQMKYYLALPDGVYVYDYQKGFWNRENVDNVVDIVATDEQLWFLLQDADDLNKVSFWRQSTEADAAEGTVTWSATFGAYGYDYKYKKYLSRFDLRFQMAKGSYCDVYLQYDHDGIWHKAGRIQGKGVNSHLIPVIPRRCDHCQLKLEGAGDMRLITLCRILEQGSDA